MLKIIIFLVLIFTIIYFVTNLILSKRQNGLVKFIIPIALTLIIVGILFFILILNFFALQSNQINHSEPS